MKRTRRKYKTQRNGTGNKNIVRKSRRKRQDITKDDKMELLKSNRTEMGYVKRYVMKEKCLTKNLINKKSE